MTYKIHKPIFYIFISFLILSIPFLSLSKLQMNGEVAPIKDFYILIICFFFISLFLFNKNTNLLQLFFFIFIIYSFIRLPDYTSAKLEFFKLIYAYIIFSILTKVKLNKNIILSILFIILIYSLLYGYLQQYYTFDKIYSLKLLEKKKIIELTHNPNLTSQQLINIKQNIKNIDDILSKLKNGRIFSIFINPNIFASFISIIIPICFYFLISSKTKNKIWFLIILLSSIHLIILSKSVGPIISIAISTIIISVINFKNIINRFWIKFISCFLIIIIAITCYIYLARGFKNFYNESVKTHLSNYISSLDIWKDNFWIGSGTGSFSKVYRQYILDYGNEVKYAHNYYLQTLSELGLIGGLIGAIILIFILKLIKIKNPTNSIEYYIKISIGIFLLNNLFSIDGYIPSLILIFLLLITQLEQKKIFTIKSYLVRYSIDIVILITALYEINLL